MSKMAKRKYISEFALHMNLTHTMLLQQDDLINVGEYEYFSSENPCHIYMICRRPRILIDSTNFVVNSEEIIFAFKIQRQNEYENLELKFPNSYGTNDIKIISSFPFNTFELFKDGNLVLSGKSANLLQYLGTQSTNHLDLEVLYIGQSYGVEGARTAPDRLQSHSTLQGIYSEAIIKNPDCEIWLLLTSFEKYLLTSMDGTLKVNDEDMEKDTEHLKKVTNTFLSNDLNEQQVINFTEAALIRYFQPPYNIEYKNTFPNPAHSTYSECYDLDVNSISIEVNTENVYCQLYSTTRKTKWIHIHDFFLHSKDDRISMFDFENLLSNNSSTNE